MDSPRHELLEPPALKLLRFSVIGILTVIIALILTQALMAVVPPLNKVLADALFSYQPSVHTEVLKAEWILLLTALAFAGAIMLAVWKFGLGSWKSIAGGAAAVAAVLAFLAHDAPAIKQPITLDQFSPPFPGSDKSFAVLMRYGKQQALAKNFRSPNFKDPYPSFNTHDIGKWRATILLRRSEIEAHWRELAPQRAWWEELNTFDRIGDLTLPSYDSDIVAFQVFRTLSQHATAMAGLEAIDGHGDEAVETILPYLRVARKLQPSSRTLVRTMVSVVIERMCLDTSVFILDTASVSPASRAKLEDALMGGDAELGARRMIESEYVLSMNASKEFHANDFVDITNAGKSRSGIARILKVLSPFVYNPRSTFNKAADVSAELQDIAGMRQLDKFDPWTKNFLSEETHPSFKNPIGVMFLQQMTPAYEKVSENYWKTEDQRVALLARLKAA